MSALSVGLADLLVLTFGLVGLLLILPILLTLEALPPLVTFCLLSWASFLVPSFEALPFLPFFFETALTHFKEVWKPLVLIS